MKYLIIDEHTPHCRMSKFPEYKREDCFVFQYMYKFFLVINCACQSVGFHPDYQLMILNKLFVREKWVPVTKANNLKRAIAEKSLDVLLKRPVTEICYTYSDGAGKAYCFVNIIPYEEYLALATNYKEVFKYTLKRISKSEMFEEYRKEQVYESVRELYLQNSHEYDELSDTQVVKLTDMLNRNFLKQII